MEGKKKKKTKKEQIREMNERVQRPLNGQECLRECKDSRVKKSCVHGQEHWGMKLGGML